jgi:hypothetical protein
MDFNSELISHGGITMPNMRLIGIEIVFPYPQDKRGRVWIPLSVANHLIYGRNGVGKSTIIDCIKAALTGNKPNYPGVRVDLYVEVFDEPDDSIREQFDSRLDNASQLNIELEDKNIFWNDPSEIKQLSLEDRRFFSEFRRALALSEVQNAYMDYETFESEFADLFPDRKSFDINEFVNPEYRVQCNLATLRRSLLLSLYKRDSSEMFRDVVDVKLDLVRNAFREASEQRYYCLSPVGSGRWNIEMAASLSETTPALNQLISDCMAIRKRVQVEADWVSKFDEDDFLNDLYPSMTMVDWNMPSTQILGPEAVHPFVRLSSWDSDMLLLHSKLADKDLPVIMDLNSKFDLATWSKVELQRAFQAGKAWREDAPTWEVRFSQIVDVVSADDDSGREHLLSESVVESTALVRLDDLFASISTQIGALDIGLSAVKYELSAAIRDWIDGSPLRVTAQDQTTGVWVQYEELSDAQRYTVGMLIQSGQALQDDYIFVGIADEPDRNLHPTAVRNLFSFIQDRFPLSYIATHSPVALAQRDMARLHAYRDHDGYLHVAKWEPSRNIESSAIELGVDRTHLLSAIGLIIVVEGEHDRVALEALMSGVGHAGSLQTMVIPMRGHGGVTTIADSFVWLEMTDARIIALTDNATSFHLPDLRSQAISLLRSGKSARVVHKEIAATWSPEIKTPEEKSLLDLLLRSVQCGAVERIAAFGLTLGDIIEYVNPQHFGLRHAWSELRNEYENSQHRVSFKKWLSDQYDAKISVKTVREAFENLDYLHADLVGLLGLINDLSR